MKKKPTFLRNTGPFEFFIDTNSFEIGTLYVDERDKIKQIQPDRAFKKDIPNWNLQKTCDGDIFYRSIKQEAEIFDPNMLKYMRTRERGISKPKATISMDYNTMVEKARRERREWKKTARLGDSDFKH
jgi:hypothetical protein